MVTKDVRADVLYEKLIHKKMISWDHVKLEPTVGTNGEYGDYAVYEFDKVPMAFGMKLKITGLDVSSTEEVDVEIAFESEKDVLLQTYKCTSESCYAVFTPSAFADKTVLNELGAIRKIKVRAKSNLTATASKVVLHIIYSG